MSLSFFSRSLSVIGKHSFRSQKNIQVGRFFSSHVPSHDAHHASTPAKELPGYKVPPELIPKNEAHTHLFPHEEGDYIPPTETGAFGDEKHEIDFGPFDDSVLTGKFGTQSEPVIVPSRFQTRIIGCTGGSEEHELLWHEVKVGKDIVCMDCGQFFRLKQIEGFEESHHDEHEFHGHQDGEGFRYMYPPKTEPELAKEGAERAEELKKDPKAAVKKIKNEGVDFHQYEENQDEGRLASKAPIFHDKREQIHKDRK